MIPWSHNDDTFAISGGESQGNAIKEWLTAELTLTMGLPEPCHLQIFT